MIWILAVLILSAVVLFVIFMAKTAEWIVERAYGEGGY